MKLINSRLEPPPSRFLFAFQMLLIIKLSRIVLLKISLDVEMMFGRDSERPKLAPSLLNLCKAAFTRATFLRAIF